MGDCGRISASREGQSVQDGEGSHEEGGRTFLFFKSVSSQVRLPVTLDIIISAQLRLLSVSFSVQTMNKNWF